MEINENSAATGEKAQELAAPDTGAKVQDPAEPAADDVVIEIPPEAAKDGDKEGQAQKNEKPATQKPANDTQNIANDTQTAEERRAQAAARKARERAEAQRLEQAHAAAEQAKVDQIYAKAYEGQISPYTNKPIVSEADYKAYKASYEKEKRDQELEKSGISEDTLNAIVEQHPAIQQAKRAAQAAEAEQTRAREAEADAYFKNEFTSISALDADVKDLESFKTKYPEQFESTINDFKHGIALSKAFKANCFDALTQRRAAAAKQAAINNAAGKAHLITTNVDGGQAVHIPRETLERYREVLPGKTDAEYAKHYASHHKEK